MADFGGFPRQTLEFLDGLRSNNTKTWFDGHREDYERYWLEPARSFVEAVGPALRTVAPGINAEPRVNGSIFRINRDVRFSKDKRPYKDHIDLWFWEGERKGAVSGYYFRLTPMTLGIGAGAHGFDRDRLAGYRAAVANPASGPALTRAVRAVEDAGWVMKGEHYKRLPAGWDVPASRERLLRFNALWVGEDEPLWHVAHSPDLVDYCVGRWREMAPLHRWLIKWLG
jgi:uncharacterized protein (TIGR02453 family)